MTRDDARTIVKKGTLALATGLGVAALVVAVAAAPAEARKKSKAAKPVEAALPDPDNGEPMTLVVSLARQTVDVYRGTTHITSSRVSTGMRGYATKAGVFSILEKRRHHHSNLYSGAPMPWMQRLTWSGTALHGGVVPGYPASHGCVRLPFSFAPKLFSITTVGEHVVVARDPVTPRPIEHANLFNPLTPVAPAVVKQDVRPERESSNTVAPPRPGATTLPVVLARADVGGVASDVAPTLGGPLPSEDATDHAAIEPEKPASGDAAPVEDTRTHAFDPLAASPKSSTEHAIMTPEDGVTTDHADAKDDADEPAPAKAQAESKPTPAPASLISAPIAASPETTQSISTAPSTPSSTPASPAETAAAEPAPAKVETPAAPAASDTPVTAEAKPEQAKPEETKPAEAKPEDAKAAETTPAPTAPAEAKTAEPRVAESPVAPAQAETASSPTTPAETTPADPAPAKSQEAATAPATPVAPATETAAPEAATVIPASVSAPSPTETPAATVLPEAAPSLAALSLGAGAKAAALEAAEPRSTAPLRILVTRRTKTDRIIGVQNLLAELGHLERQNFDGTLGRPTIAAIKAFQKANGLPENGAFTDELVKKVYEVAGKGEPPEGHLFVRQEFGRVFDAPVSFKDPEKPLGTHLFTALKFAPGDTKARWIAISLQGDESSEALDRIEIPEDVRRNISERLTPGSSLIIGDVAINSANLPKGADFLVWAKDMPAKITAASYEPEAAPRPRKKKRVARAPRRQQDYTFRYAPAPRTYQAPRSFSPGYPRWPF